MPTTISPAREESNANLLQNEFVNALRTETGLQGEYAAMIAAALVRGMRKQLGGQRVYIPTYPANEQRDTAIRQRFNGQNAAELCAEFDISRTRLYQIAAQRKTQ